MMTRDVPSDLEGGDLEAPVDPRTDWELPPVGALPTRAELDETTTRVIADNPSPMTLDGTNTYLVGAPGSGVVTVVDPGPDDPEHLAAVEAALADRDAEVGAVLVTHHHVDHAAAAQPWAAHFGCGVAAWQEEVAGADGRVLSPGDDVTLGGFSIEVVATPGHATDHLAFRLPTGALLTGDHVLGRGTSVVAHPDGDLVDYLDSLRRVLALGPDVLYPGHGPELTEDPVAVVRYYLEHRRFRQHQILAFLDDGPATPRELVEVIYADVDTALWPAAEASTRAALRALAATGAVAPADREDAVRRLEDPGAADAGQDPAPDTDAEVTP